MCMKPVSLPVDIDRTLAWEGLQGVVGHHVHRHVQI